MDYVWKTTLIGPRWGRSSATPLPTGAIWSPPPPVSNAWETPSISLPRPGKNRPKTSNAWKLPAFLLPRVGIRMPPVTRGENSGKGHSFCVPITPHGSEIVFRAAVGEEPRSLIMLPSRCKRGNTRG